MRRLEAREPVLLIDVRRRATLSEQPNGLIGAVPLLLDDAEPRIPDLARGTDIVTYCLCSGQASSTRVAQWLLRAGYTNVAILEGGLPAWMAAGFPTKPLDSEARGRIKAWIDPMRSNFHEAASGSALIAESAFLAGIKLPAKRELAVLFVDIVDSTSLLADRPAEEVMELIQAVMRVVVDVAVQHCGDVHDFEGDGAMLYFAGPREALNAAFSLRAALSDLRHERREIPQVRFAMDYGPLVVGYVGTTERRGLSFVGPSINTAARILKLGPPNSVVATQAVLEHARRSAPHLVAAFGAVMEKQYLKGIPQPVTIYVARGATGLDGDMSDPTEVAQ